MIRSSSQRCRSIHASLGIEEAQRLGYDAIEYIRRLHDHPSTRFGVVFVGGNRTWQVIQRFEMVESRIVERVEFQPLAPDVVVEKMPGFHPLLARTDRWLLRHIDNQWGRGNFRRWGHFVEHAIEICEQHRRATVDEQVAKNVFTQLVADWGDPRPLQSQTKPRKNDPEDGDRDDD